MQTAQQLEDLERFSAEQLLTWAIRSFGRDFAVLTSFQAEGMVIVDMSVRIDPGVRILTVDTGRLPEATHEMIDTVRRHYGINVQVLQPDAEEAGRMVTRFGTNLFHESVAQRRLCCEVRKVRPFSREQEHLRTWAVGLRRGQGVARADVPKITPERGGRMKLSPLADWTSEQVSAYTRSHNVPVHPLYAQGYTSIGCGPCTRATRSGESERAGRWWWEEDGNSECGLHFAADGRVERSVDVLLREILTA